MFRSILEWTDSEQRLRIAAEFGITTEEGIRKHLHWNDSKYKNRVKRPNFCLIRRLAEEAEKNKALAGV